MEAVPVGMLEHLPCSLCIAVGQFLVPSLADARCCYDTNLESKINLADCDVCDEKVLAFHRVLVSLDVFQDLLNSCRWANLFFPQLLTKIQFSPILARFGCSRLLGIAPVAPSRRSRCRREPWPCCGEGTELHLAVMSGNARTVRVAVARHSRRLNFPDSIGETALYKACMLHFHPAVQILLEARAAPDAFSGDVAGWDGRRFLPLDRYNPQTALLVACARRDLCTVDLLLAHRADPSGTCSFLHEATTPLAAASVRHAALLVARPTESRNFPLSEKEPLDIARTLLAARADAEEGPQWYLGKTPVWLAARDGLTGVLDLLLRHGASPNVADYHGDSALHIAYALDHLDDVALLLGARADANVVDADGCTPEQVRAARLRLLGLRWTR